jgi:glycosyltransferase involved in cell wall biosynthesis
VGRSLVTSLARLLPGTPVLLSAPAGCGFEAIDLPHGSRVSFMERGSVPARLRYELVTLPRLIRDFQVDGALALGNIGVSRLPESVVQGILVQNAHLYHPVLSSGKTANVTPGARVHNGLLQLKLGWDLQNTAFLACQTREAAERVRSFYSYRGDVIVCPNAVASEVASGELPPMIEGALARNQGNFRTLYVTQYYPHKNLEALVELFATCRQRLSSVVLFITVARSQHGGVERLLRSIERLGLEEQIVNLGPVEPGILPSLYARCDALLMPSLLESFSASYLEAMAFGVPVVTSERSFARAICEDAACYFDPRSIDSICSALLRVRDDARYRRALVEAGRRHAAATRTTWDDVARQLCERLDAAVGERQRRVTEPARVTRSRTAGLS